MANTDGIVQPETEISNVLVEPIDPEQQPTIESTIAEEIRDERIEKDISIKENLTDETINSIHTFLFEILAFFSNSQSSLIAEYCQETENVCRKYFHRLMTFIVYFSGIIFKVFLMMKILIFYLYSSVIHKNELILTKDQVSVNIF